MTRVGVIGGYCQLIEALKESARLEKLNRELFSPLFRAMGRAARNRDRHPKSGGRR